MVMLLMRMIVLLMVMMTMMPRLRITLVVPRYLHKASPQSIEENYDHDNNDRVEDDGDDDDAAWGYQGGTGYLHKASPQPICLVSLADRRPHAALGQSSMLTLCYFRN